MLPGLGPSVIGGSWTPYDGHANPLALLHALHKGFAENRGRYFRTPRSAMPRWPRRLSHRRRRRRDRRAQSGSRRRARQREFGAAFRAERSGPAAKGSDPRHRAGAAPAGDADHHDPPDRRGQHHAGRQSGGCRFDTSQKPAVMQTIARRAVRSFPWLRDLQIVRAWAALRVMPPDGLPIYDQSERFPVGLHRQLPQRGHPRRRPCQRLRADGRRGRARTGTRPLFGKAFRCSGRGLRATRRPSPSSSKDARSLFPPALRRPQRSSWPVCAAFARPRSRAASGGPIA